MTSNAGSNIWKYRGDENVRPTPELVEAAGGSPLVAGMLLNRGLTTPDAMRAFLDLENYQSASGRELPDADKAIARIRRAIDSSEPVMIYGDFDVDGQTGTSILYQCLKYLGANVSYYVPDRATEGHGLNTASLIRLKSSRNFKLVITTDTGITNFAEVSLLNGLGVETIITDHHELPENLPPALASVNPRRLEDGGHPLHLLCGAGVAFKLCEALLEELGQPEYARHLLDLAAIGTICDMVPLIRENRYLVWQGLKELNKRRRPGLREILEQAGVAEDKPLNSDTAGFTIGPRLNAIGRLDHAGEAVELLTGDDPERIRQIAARLESLNRRRREMCDETFLDAEKYLQNAGGLNGNRALVLASPDWHPGIVGIVASRLIEKYRVPVFMMVVDESKGEVRCSARSVPGFDLHAEVLTPLAHFYDHGGGHAGAGGFSMPLSRLEAFKKELYAIAGQRVTDEMMRPVIDVDAKLAWSQINPHLVELINRMAPFGMDNPTPKFVVENVLVSAQRGIGENQRHMKLILTEKGSKAFIDGLIWNFGSNREKFNPAAPYSFVVMPELNTFNNQTKVQLIIEDYLGAAQSAGAQETTVTAGTTDDPAAKQLASPKPAITTIPANSANGRTNWIDHRSREGVDTFIGQLMLPLQDRASVLIYNEGKKPDIPFLKEELLVSRHQAKAADELILWDLPPAAGVFRHLLEAVRPKTLHIVGGKYRNVPVFPSEDQYLKVILQVLRGKAARISGNGRAVEINLPEFSGQLASTPEIVTSGLILLDKLGQTETVLAGKGPDIVRVAVNPAPPAVNDYTRHLEFAAFSRHLRDMGEFRNWLLGGDLVTIKSAVYSAAVHRVHGPSNSHHSVLQEV